MNQALKDTIHITASCTIFIARQPPLSPFFAIFGDGKKHFDANAPTPSAKHCTKSLPLAPARKNRSAVLEAGTCLNSA